MASNFADTVEPASKSREMIAINVPSEDDIPEGVKTGEKLELIDLRSGPGRGEIDISTKRKLSVLRRSLARKNVKLITGAAPGTTEHRPCARW